MLKTLRFSYISLIFAISFVPMLSFAQSVTPEISLPNNGLSCPAISMNLYRGMRDARTNGAVSDLQQYLADTYNVDPDILVTGYFGPKTESYVKRFQRDNNIQQTGVAGPITRAAIVRVCGTGPVACTQEMKQCPDGSYVGRTGPNCSFPACLGTTMCDYPEPPAGCNYVRGTNYNPTTQCGMVLNCSGSSLPTAKLSSNTTSVSRGGSATLTWSSTNTTTCRLDSSVTGFLGTLPPSGTVVANNFTLTATLTLACSGQGGTAQDQLVINVGTVSPNVQPVITSLSPTSGPVGTTITINGTGFVASNDIYLDGKFIETFYRDTPGEALMFTIPTSFPQNCTYNGVCTNSNTSVNPGTHLISIKNQNGTSNSVSFEVTGGMTVTIPKIDSLSPSSGPTGTTVSINGSGITSDTVIYFNNQIVQNLQKYNGTFSFVVPSTISNCPVGAYCFVGPQPVTPDIYSVFVKNSNGTSNSVSFTVTSRSNPAASLEFIGMKDVYSVGEQITVSIRNNGTVDATLSSGVGCGLAFYGADIKNVSTGTVVQYNNPMMLCGVPPTNFILRPGETKNLGTWDQKEWLPIATTNSNSTSLMYGSQNVLTGYYSITVYGITKNFLIVGDNAFSKPAITSLYPNYGAVGTTVTVFGSGFTKNSVVLFDGYVLTNTNHIANQDSLPTTTLTFTVPNGVMPVCPPNMYCTQSMKMITPGTYMVSVKNLDAISNQIPFTVTDTLYY